MSSRLTARTATADKVVKSVCPYCAVGCGQGAPGCRRRERRRPDRRVCRDPLGVFHAGMASARDPKYTVVPQRQRLTERAAAEAARAGRPPAVPPA